MSHNRKWTNVYYSKFNEHRFVIRRTLQLRKSRPSGKKPTNAKIAVLYDAVLNQDLHSRSYLIWLLRDVPWSVVA